MESIVFRNLQASFLHASTNNNIQVLEYISTLVNGYRKHSLIRECAFVALDNDNMPIIEWTMQHMSGAELYPEDTAFIKSAQTANFLLTKGWVPTQKGLEYAAKCGSVAIVKWMLQRGITLKEAIVPFENKDQIIGVYHEYDIPGDYTKECTSECKWCKREQIKDMWIMENVEYTDMMQWLPCEMMEEVVAFMA